MNSTENKTDIATQKARESLQEKEKGSGDLKSETSPHKRTASEVNSTEDVEGKQKLLKTDHKEKENGETEDKLEEEEEEADEEDEEFPLGEGEDFDEDGVDEEDDEDGDDDA
ncbi:glutamic acid-rich protein-like [Limulus polyphemus]|uniref:Glutamic acid-rich protein-like n=1 Tax=Limulus polyphemus TaxID=6850 RepID=A0ABM1B3G0_LIMPO|nr:glutamic acid-rich protein-like [Limulus polyphemus]